MPEGSRSFESRESADPSALTAIYRAHSAYVWRVLRHCGVPDSDLDDAVQDTFLVVMRRLPEFRGHASLRTWIYAVAVRVASTRRRSDTREAARRTKAGEGMHGRSTVDPEDHLARAEAGHLVDTLLEQLDPPKRTVFVLAEIEGVEVREISRILGVNPRTVHSRLRLARERFGTALRRMHARERGNQRVSQLRPRAVLQAAAQERPEARRRKAVAAAVALQLEQGSSPAVPGWESITLSSSGGWTLPIVVGAVAGALGLTWVASTSAGEQPEREPQTVAATVPRAEPVAPPSPPAVPPPPAVVDATVEPPPVEPVPPPRASAASTEPSPKRRASKARRSTKPSATTVPPPTAASTLAEETRLLELARGALRRGDTSKALSVLDDYDARFDRGVLRDEARSTRLKVLCTAGRADDARAVARRYAAGSAPSRWDRIVTAACGGA
ncbi:MAG: RNA polymerase sigma factor [Myxococcota bacterium]